eukprot:779494-Ditylum_brightwellii.AAC.1
MTENTDDKKKAATSETGDKKMPANMNGIEEDEGLAMDETVPVTSESDNTPLKKKTYVLMEKKTPTLSLG